MTASARSARIGCIEVSPGGPLVQGELVAAPCINADLGGCDDGIPPGGICDCGRRASVRIGAARIAGTRIPSIRRTENA